MSLTNLGGVVRRTKDQLWRTIVPRANIRHVRLILNQDFGTPKITELENTSAWIEQEILRLDIAVADTL